MSSVPSLVWSSRESIRAQLLSLLRTTPRADSRLRRRIVRLLGIFAGPDLPSHLLPMACDSGEDDSVRSQALRALVTHGPPLSGPELTRLFESPLATMCPCCCPSLESILTLARTEEAWAAAEAALQKVSPLERASALAEASHTPLPSRLVEWLYTQWHTCDRHRLAAEGPRGHRANLRVAVAWSDRPEAGALLDGWPHDADASEWDEAILGTLSAEELSYLVRASPRLQQRAAELLLLPLADLQAHFGQEALLRRLKYTVRAKSAAQRVPHGIMPSPPAYPRAAKLLVQWRNARPLLCSLLCDFGLAEEVRQRLLGLLFDHDRAMAARWTLVAARYPGNAPLVHFVLRRAAYEPEPSDRSLFLAALRGSDDEARAYALEGLLALGESGAGWRDRLSSLVHSCHARVRLRAAACLAREGMREWLPLLRQTALEASEPHLRDEAVRWLAQVDAEASRPLLTKVLAEAMEREPWQLQLHSGADEAAWGLSRLGTTEDLSLLLDAALRACCSQRLDQELEYHLARQEGRPAEGIPRPGLPGTRMTPTPSAL